MLRSLRAGAAVCGGLLCGPGFAGLSAIDVESDPPDVIQTCAARPEAVAAPPNFDPLMELSPGQFMPVSVHPPRLPATLAREPVAVGVVPDRSALAVPLPAAVWPGLATVGALAVGLAVRRRRSRRAVS